MQRRDSTRDWDEAWSGIVGSDVPSNALVYVRSLPAQWPPVVVAATTPARPVLGPVDRETALELSAWPRRTTWRARANEWSLTKARSAAKPYRTQWRVPRADD